MNATIMHVFTCLHVWKCSENGKESEMLLPTMKKTGKNFRTKIQQHTDTKWIVNHPLPTRYFYFRNTICDYKLQQKFKFNWFVMRLLLHMQMYYILKIFLFYNEVYYLSRFTFSHQLKIQLKYLKLNQPNCINIFL